jgi:SEL1 protein
MRRRRVGPASASGFYTTDGLRTAYEHFLAGPPGGRTLPLQPTKLSDLVGGVYGYGASWASTGMNVNRAGIKAGNSVAGGETFEDVIEYYRVSPVHRVRGPG